MFDEEEQTFTSLAGPSSSRMSDFWFLAAKILSQAGYWDSLITNPEETFVKDDVPSYAETR
jgi:hypothetical protein